MFSGESLPRAGKEPGELGELRSTLLILLRDSRCYQPQNLLTHFPDSKWSFIRQYIWLIRHVRYFTFYFIVTQLNFYTVLRFFWRTCIIVGKTGSAWGSIGNLYPCFEWYWYGFIVSVFFNFGEVKYAILLLS